MLEAHEYEQLDDAGRRAADTVIDLEADESTCPACADAIPRGSTRCPGCGLRIG